MIGELFAASRAAITKSRCGATVCVQRKQLCVHFDVTKSASNVLLYTKDLQMCARMYTRHTGVCSIL